MGISSEVRIALSPADVAVIVDSIVGKSAVNIKGIVRGIDLSYLTLFYH